MEPKDQPALNALDKLAREYYVRGAWDEKHRHRKRPVWTRFGFWLLLMQHARTIDHYDVNKVEFDRSFPEG